VSQHSHSLQIARDALRAIADGDTTDARATARAALETMKKVLELKKGRQRSLTRLVVLQGGHCYWCKEKFTDGDGAPSRDHVIPRSRGGQSRGNIVAACIRCNRTKGDLSAEDFSLLIAKGFLPPRGVLRRRRIAISMLKTSLAKVEVRNWDEDRYTLGESK